MSKYITITGYCSKTKRPLGIQIKEENGYYLTVGSYAVAGGAASGADSASYTGKLLDGTTFACKHCGNKCTVQCSCGTVMCLGLGEEYVTCPVCGKQSHISWVDDIDQVSDSSINSNKQ